MSSDDHKPSVGINTTNNYQVIGDHIKIAIEQTVKGARVTATIDRSDHDIDEAVGQAVRTYKETIEHLKEMGLKVDENGGGI